MKIKKGDKVKILSGKEKGKTGVVGSVMPSNLKVIVNGLNLVSRHTKPRGKQEGGIIKKSMPMFISKVMFICPKCSKYARIGYKLVKGKKYRMCKKCKETLN